jgi:hypothetical protein
MTISLKADAQIAPAKIYNLELRDKAFVDKKFDKLHDTGRIKWII